MIYRTVQSWVESAKGWKELYRPKRASVMLIAIQHVLGITILLRRSNKIAKLCTVGKREGDPIVKTLIKIIRMIKTFLSHQTKDIKEKFDNSNS